MITVTSHFSEKVVGEVLIPGDKSISHRSLMIGASAIGETKVKGLLESDDVIATVHALRCLGVDIEKDEKNGIWIILRQTNLYRYCALSRYQSST